MPVPRSSAVIRELENSSLGMKAQRFGGRLLVALLFLGCLVCLLESFQSFRKRGRPPCLNNLRGILLAFHAYHDEFGRFPPAFTEDDEGRPMHSWRALIARQLEAVWQADAEWLERERWNNAPRDRGDMSRSAQAAWAKQRQLRDFLDAYDFSQPWDSPANRRLADLPADAFHCPNAVRSPSMVANYVVVVGDGTAFPGSKTTSFDDLSDGSSNTLLLVEFKDSTIRWLTPRDVSVAELALIQTDSPLGSSAHLGGFHVGYADGHVSYVPQSTTEAHLQALLTIAGHEDLRQFEPSNDDRMAK